MNAEMTNSDEYSHEWQLWDVDNPLTGSIVCAKRDLAEEIAKYNQPRFRCVDSHYMYHSMLGDEVRIWHFRRYPLKSEARS